MRTCLIFLRSSLSCFRLSSFLLNFLSDVYRDTFSSLVYESIIILCCLSWYFFSTVEVILLLVYLFDLIVLEAPLFHWLRNQSRVLSVFQSRFCDVCCDMFLSTAKVLLLLVYFFGPIVLETTSVIWIKNHSIVFTLFKIFYYMEYYWINMFWLILVFSRTYTTCIGLCHNRAETFFWIMFVGTYIALKLIEDQRIVECWDVYWYENDTRTESCLIMGCILLWNWQKIRGLLNAVEICIQLTCKIV